MIHLQFWYYDESVPPVATPGSNLFSFSFLLHFHFLTSFILLNTFPPSSNTCNHLPPTQTHIFQTPTTYPYRETTTTKFTSSQTLNPSMLDCIGTLTFRKLKSRNSSLKCHLPNSSNLATTRFLLWYSWLRRRMVASDSVWTTELQTH